MTRYRIIGPQINTKNRRAFSQYQGSRFAFGATLTCLLLASASSFAQTVKGTRIEPFFANHCFDCHSGNDPQSGLDLESLSTRLADPEVRHQWVHVFDRIASGEMPPESAAKPARQSRASVLGAIEAAITRQDLNDRGVVLRRLNHIQYTNTVNDLFGIDVDVSRVLIADEARSGFDNTGSELSVSADQLKRYVDAADLVLDQVLGPKEKPKTFHKRIECKDFWVHERVDRFTDEGGIMFSRQGLPVWNTSVLTVGTYRVRVRAKAAQSDQPVVIRISGGLTGLIAPHVVGFFEVPPGEFTTIDVVDRARERGDCYRLSFDAGFPWDLNREKALDYEGPGVLIKDIEVEGPLEPWPPESRKRLLGNIDPAKGTIDDIRSILLRVLPRALRRSRKDLDPTLYVALAQQAIDEGLGFETALRRALMGVLCGPEFLYLEEFQTADNSRIDDYALASRLSYFLWNSMPDDELFAVADRGSLSGSDELRQQVARLLADPKSQRFVESFTGQWLRLYDIDFTVPSRTRYPEFNQLLRQSMLDETHRFFREILDRDLSVLSFIDSDFVMINQPLAELYGIDGVKGLQIRKVSLPEDSVRGGVLTQASVLKVSADGTRTSPVLRGVWILNHLFATPPPPPPPTVSIVEPDTRGTTSIREQLQRHRADESCNRCHRKIDPPGFALESFDVIGANRQWYRTSDGKWIRKLLHPHSTANVLYKKGPDVDSSGVMPDGRPFTDIREYKRLLLKDKTALPTALTRQLMGYALGRKIGFSDRAEVQRIVAGIRGKNYGLQSLIHAIVQSELYQRP